MSFPSRISINQYSEGRERTAKRLRRDTKESRVISGYKRASLGPEHTTILTATKPRVLPTNGIELKEVDPIIVARSQGESSSSKTCGPGLFNTSSLGQSEFRLFVLDPGEFGDKLTGRLAKHSLAAPPVYHGVSYVWGQESPIHSATVEDGGIREILIRPNLFQALRRIRDISSQLHLWIDDVCIRQEDENEKNSQVSYMADIYHKAASVFIWLGEDDASSAAAREYIRSVIDLDYDWSQPWWRSPGISALIRLLNRPWFSRGWVIQEAAFSRSLTIYCGDWQLPMEHLMQAIERIQHRLSSVDRSLISAADDDNFVSFHDSSAVKFASVIRMVFFSDDDTIVRRCLSLENLVDETRFTETSDCRDSIYAVLSLANDVGAALPRPLPGSIVADYSKRHLEAYVDLIQHCAQQSLSLDIICRPWAPILQPSQAAPMLPSWIVSKDRMPSGIPSAQYVRRIHADPLVGNSRKRIYSCSFNKTPQIWFGTKWNAERNTGESDGTLNAKGIVLGQITSISTRMADGIVYQDVLEILGGVKRCAVTHWSFPDAIWRTLCADRDANGDRAPRYYRSMMLDILQFVASGIDPSLLPCIDVEDLLATAELGSSLPFLKRIRDTVWNRRAVRLKSDPAEQNISKSMVGLVPRAAKIGDVICILYGCSVPVVLRKRQSSTSDTSWLLVGEAYVDGIMDGEEIKHASMSGTLKPREVEVKIK
ncbi:hypothetical protein LTS17_006393 [Exophiala oligosperma]